MLTDFEALGAELARLSNTRRVGRVTAVGTAALEIAGLSNHARIGDQVAIGLGGRAAQELGGEVVGVSEAVVRAMTYAPLDGAAVGDAATLLGPAGVHPAETWVGRIVDAFGQPLDGRPLTPGAASATLRRAPPPPATRKGLGRPARHRARGLRHGRCRSPAGSASASSPARASASRRSSPTSRAASRRRSSSMR